MPSDAGFLAGPFEVALRELEFGVDAMHVALAALLRLGGGSDERAQVEQVLLRLGERVDARLGGRGGQVARLDLENDLIADGPFVRRRAFVRSRRGVPARLSRGAGGATGA